MQTPNWQQEQASVQCAVCIEPRAGEQKQCWAQTSHSLQPKPVQAEEEPSQSDQLHHIKCRSPTMLKLLLDWTGALYTSLLLKVLDGLKEASGAQIFLADYGQCNNPLEWKKTQLWIVWRSVPESLDVLIKDNSQQISKEWTKIYTLLKDN